MSQIKVNDEALERVEYVFKTALEQILDVVKQSPSQREYDELKIDLQTKENSLKCRASNFESRIFNLKSKISQAEYEISQAKSEISQAEYEVSSLNIQLSTNKNEQESIKARLRNEQNKLATAKQKLSSAMFEKNKYQEELRSHEAELNRVLNLLSSIRSLYTKLSNSLENYLRFLSYSNMSSKDIVDKMQSKLAKIKNSIESYNNINLDIAVAPQHTDKKASPKKNKVKSFNETEYTIGVFKVKTYMANNKIAVDFFTDEKIGTIYIKLKRNSIGIIVRNSSFFENEKKSIFELVHRFARDNDVKELYAWVDEDMIGDFKEYGFYIDGEVLKHSGAQMIKKL